jgi:hypothetical protein
MTPIAGFGFLLVLGIQHYTLKRATRQAGPNAGEGKAKAVVDAEAAAPVAAGEAQPLDVEKAVGTDAANGGATRDVEKGTA